jgi:O-antigen/teichoic acid export membrane protein
VLLLCAFSADLLALWTGADFAQKSGLVLAWFSVGVLINSGAQVIATFVQARGRADFTAKLYIVEFPLYCGLLLWLVPQFGIAGAAYAWVARIVFDAVALLAFGVWLMPAMRALLPGIVAAAGIAASVCVVAYATQSLTAKAAILAVSLLGTAAFAWKRAFAGTEGGVPWRRIGNR